MLYLLILAHKKENKMDELKEYLSEMDFKTMLLLFIGYTLFVIGKYYASSFSNRKMVFLIKIIPFLLALILEANTFINKVHHQMFEGTLIIVLMVLSVFSLFNKNNDSDSFFW